MKKILMSVVLAGAVLFGASAEYYGDVIPLAKTEKFVIERTGVEAGINEFYNIGDYSVKIYTPYEKYSDEQQKKLGSVFKNVFLGNEFTVSEKNLIDYQAACLVANMPIGWKTFLVQSNVKGENGKHLVIIGCRKSNGEILYMLSYQAEKMIK